MRKRLAIVFLLFPLLHYSQTRSSEAITPVDSCVSSDDVHLYRLINEYRLVFGLEIIPFSKSLCYVAKTHVRDLFANRPDLQSCNLHSWSDKGQWTPCCYAKDPNRTSCMWNKPRELTTYMGDGQELIMWENIPASPQSAFDQWRSFDLTNDMMLNRGRWADNEWKAIGIAIYQGYASVWFGEVDDHEPSLLLCENQNELAADWLITEIHETPEEEAEPEEAVPDSRYYLIVSSFKEESMAASEVKRLQAGGYENAKALMVDDNFRVSIYDYTDLSEAQKMRRQLSNVFKGIWIMEQ